MKRLPAGLSAQRGGMNDDLRRQACRKYPLASSDLKFPVSDSG